MADDVTRGIFQGLVLRAGGVEAVAAVLDARYGKGNKGHVSKMCSGVNGVTIDAAVAVEDFVGAFPITNRMFERTALADRRVGCLQSLAAKSAEASGQAHAVLIRAYSSLSEDATQMTAQERAQVIANARAARQVLTDIIDAAEAAG